MKIKRNLSGIYFRVENKQTNKFENIVFEDLTEEQQDLMLENRDEKWLKSLAKSLADVINRLGDQFDIETE